MPCAQPSTMRARNAADCADLGRRAIIFNLFHSAATISRGCLGRPVRIPKYAAYLDLFNGFLAQNTSASSPEGRQPLRCTSDPRIRRLPHAPKMSTRRFGSRLSIADQFSPITPFFNDYREKPPTAAGFGRRLVYFGFRSASVERYSEQSSRPAETENVPILRSRFDQYTNMDFNSGERPGQTFQAVSSCKATAPSRLGNRYGLVDSDQSREACP